MSCPPNIIYPKQPKLEKPNWWNRDTKLGVFETSWFPCDSITHTKQSSNTTKNSLFKSSRWELSGALSIMASFSKINSFLHVQLFFFKNFLLTCCFPAKILQLINYISSLQISNLSWWVMTSIKALNTLEKSPYSSSHNLPQCIHVRNWITCNIFNIKTFFNIKNQLRISCMEGSNLFVSASFF